MRITGGTLVGRKFAPPLSETTRPMRDRVRQALFNILAHRDWGFATGNLFDGTQVLDAFCGTGALAFEALSFGAAQAILFDKDAAALKVARQNAASLGVAGRCNILSADTLNPPRAPQACNLIFLAPPYRMGLIPPALIALKKSGWIAPHAVILAETAGKEELPLPEGFTVELTRSYGDTRLSFLKEIVA